MLGGGDPESGLQIISGETGMEGLVESWVCTKNGGRVGGRAPLHRLRS